MAPCCATPCVPHCMRTPSPAVQVVALLLVFAASGAVLVALRPFNSAALGTLELVATLAPLTSFALALGVLGSRGASDSTRCVCVCVCGVVYVAGRW